MTAEIETFDPRPGGAYRMAFIYLGEGAGKTSAKADVFDGRLVELVPDRKIVEQVVFQSDDSEFRGAMTLTTTLTPVEGGTRVDVAVENVPAGITPQDHRAGMQSSLANLAAFVEGGASTRRGPRPH